MDFKAASWSALPISFYQPGEVQNYTTGVNTGVVYLRKHHNSNAIPEAPPSLYFKVVVIQGEAATTARAHGVDLKNYAATQAFFKLNN